MNKITTLLLGRSDPEPARADPAAILAEAQLEVFTRSRAGWWIGAGLIVSLTILVGLMRHAGLAIDAASSVPFLIGGIVAGATRFLAPRLHLRHARAVADCAEYYLVFTLIALMGAVASYPISAMTSGYSDVALQRIDVALHFDWRAWYRAVAASQTLQFLGTAAYRSIFISPAILFAYFAGTGQRGEAYRFIVTFWLSAVITLVLFSFMPAVGPLSYLWHGPIAYMPESELWQPDLIPQLRAHTAHLIDLRHLRGIVSAPSFHAAAATVYAGTAWRIRKLRWPLVSLNAAMLLSTPVEGTHYLADILLGIAVASGALIVAHFAVRYGQRRAL